LSVRVLFVCRREPRFVDRCEHAAVVGPTLFRFSVRILSRVGARTPAERWFDIDDRRAIDRFDWTDPQPIAGDSFHDHRMEAQRVRPIL